MTDRANTVGVGLVFARPWQLSVAPSSKQHFRGVFTMTVPLRPHLFTPVQIGPITLKHRVVMAPLTRSRSEQPGDIPGGLMLEYYSQRASDGGFIVSEGTSVSLTGRGWLGAPGLYSDQQVEGWKKITVAVHTKGGYMFAQLWHTGRSSRVEMAGGHMPVSASVDPSYWADASHVVSAPSGWIKPSPHRALDIAEIPGIVEDYRKAAERAKAAGFDGVELHAANGYLPDQFFRTAATSAPTLMVAPLKTARASYSSSSRSWCRYGRRSRRCADRAKWNMERDVRQQSAGAVFLRYRAAERVWPRLPPHHRAARPRECADRRGAGPCRIRATAEDLQRQDHRGGRLRTG